MQPLDILEVLLLMLFVSAWILFSIIEEPQCPFGLGSVRPRIVASDGRGENLVRSLWFRLDSSLMRIFNTIKPFQLVSTVPERYTADSLITLQLPARL
ncbi:hypothetical protein IWX49DRAFT_596717 [Phyllosticta citricarpa]